jgi:perosamine synthetase
VTVDARRAEVFGRTVRAEFAFLKSTARFEDLVARGIPLDGDAGMLVPVCELHAGDPRTVAMLARWRDGAQAAFPSAFTVTESGTAAWLRGRLLDRADRTLFLVLDRHGVPAGHLGYVLAADERCELEIDNVVRGERDAAPGLMGAALDRLLRWAHELFAPESVVLRVLARNAHAIRFYGRHGFAEAGRIPLRRHVGDGRIDLVPREPGDDAPADAEFVRMRLERPAGADDGGTILTAGPSIGSREASYALDAVRNGWNASWRGYLDRFEAAFAEYVGVRHALPTSSCSGALHLSLLALGIGPGDEVIVPDLTWVATANAIAYVGATPVFADVDAESWCLDPDSFRAAITPRTRAVMPVHLYGHPARMDRIAAIAAEHGLHVVEDAAPAIGAECLGRRVGNYGAFSAFSFQGAKLMVTGEGGMLLTDDDELYERARLLWHQGCDRPADFWITRLGWKYKMTNVQAAIGLGQLERVDAMIESKRRIFGWYEDGLAGLPGVSLNREAGWARSIYWMTSVRVGPEAGSSRDALRAALRDAGVDTRPVFPAISQYPHWERRQAPAPTARLIGSEGINLPSGVALRRDQVERVCAAVRSAVAGVRRMAA